MECELIQLYGNNATLAEAQALLAQGMEDNANGDRYGLVSVIFSVVLFLLVSVK